MNWNTSAKKRLSRANRKGSVGSRRRDWMQGTVPIATGRIRGGGQCAPQRAHARSTGGPASSDVAMLQAFPPERAEPTPRPQRDSELQLSPGDGDIWKQLATLTPPDENAVQYRYCLGGGVSSAAAAEEPAVRYFEQGAEYSVDEGGALLELLALPVVSEAGSPAERQHFGSPTDAADALREWRGQLLLLRTEVRGTSVERFLRQDMGPIYFECDEELTEDDCRSILLSMYRSISCGVAAPREVDAILETIRLLELCLKQLQWLNDRNNYSGWSDNNNNGAESAGGSPPRREQPMPCGARLVREKWGLFSPPERARVSPLRALPTAGLDDAPLNASEFL